MDQKRLKELLHYDPEIGVWTWRVNRGGTAKAGSTAGYVRSNGYRFIGVDYKTYKCSRLAFLYMTGEIPAEVDHINRIRDDDRWCNLRPSNRAKNIWNRGKRSDNTTGHPGVYFDKKGKKYNARIKVDNKQHDLGRFSTAEEASRVYEKVRKVFHAQ